MKKIISYIKPYQFDKLIRLLNDEGVQDLYFQEIKRYTLGSGVFNFLPRIKLELYLHETDLNKIQKLIVEYKAQEIFRDDDADLYETTSIQSYTDIQTGEIFIFSS